MTIKGKVLLYIKYVRKGTHFFQKSNNYRCFFPCRKQKELLRRHFSSLLSNSSYIFGRLSNTHINRRTERYLSVFRYLSAFSRSSGVSIPIVSILLMPTFILYPFSSHLSCSKDSANSNEDCLSDVIALRTFAL